MRDRQPTQPGRVLITPENGDAFYAVMEMADDPTDLGTPPTKANLLADETEVALFGSAADRTVNQAFSGIAGKLRLIMDDLANITVTVTSTSGNGLAGLLVTGMFDSSGNEIYTDSSGMAVGYVAAGTVTLAVSGYADVEDVSETFTATKGETYSKTLVTETKNFLLLSSSKSVKFSGNVNRVDHTVVGGGGGGGGTCDVGATSSYVYASGAGGGGGYCVVSENVSFEANVSYPAVIGSGGAAGADATKNTGSGKTGGTGGTSSFMGVSASGGTGGAGGSKSSDGTVTTATGGSGNGKGGNGVYASNSTTKYVDGKPGVDGSVYGFLSFDETVLYGGGGGSGAAYHTLYPNTAVGGSGGASYGGSGGSAYPYAAATAGLGPGGGGGGAGSYRSDNATTAISAKAGHKGCVAIRMHLTAA